MCLAILAPKNTDKNSEFLFKSIENGSKANTDGMGFAYKRNSTKKVFISKGYYDVDILINNIKDKNLGPEDELIVHMRIGNKGAINMDMCHPFVCSEDSDEVLSNDVFVNKPVFIHNGTLYKYSVTNSIYSDTYFFAKDFASKTSVINMLKADKETFEKVMDAHIGTSRFAFLFPGENTNAIILGDFIEDEGYYFSNAGYRDSRVRNVGGSESYVGGHYSGWDDYYDDYYKSGNSYRRNTMEDLFAGLEDKKAKALPVVSTRKANTIRIPVPDDLPTESIEDPATGIKYRFYLGLWVPSNLINGYGDRSLIKYDPNGLNYMHLDAEGRVTDPDFKIEKYKKYSIVYFDLVDGFKMHYLNTKIGSLGDTIVVPEDVFKRNFLFSPRTNYKEAYDKYIDLVINTNHSKNQLKKLNKALSKHKNKESFCYSGLGEFKREILELYRYNLVKHLYPNVQTFEETYLKYCFA